MVTEYLRWIAVTLLLASSSAALAAPIDITARLDPGQSGPVYAWSLLLRVDPGYDVGAVQLLTNGFDGIALNSALPGIGVLDSAYTIDPLMDGRNFLLVANYENGVSLSVPDEEVLLGTFYGPSRTSPPVRLWDAEVEAGGTAFDPYPRPLPGEDVSLHAYPLAYISLRVVPEPSHGLLLALGLAAAGALRRQARGRS
jgi:hypothetical protein